MVRKRPCSICKKWFRPDPRSAGRQRVCADEGCQRERHRRACKAWRDRDAEKIKEDQLRSKLGAGEAEVRRSALRDAVGSQVAVAIEESLRVLVPATRDAFRTEVLEITKESIRLLPRARRDATDARGPAP